MSRGNTLRIILAAEAIIVWSQDAGPLNTSATIHESELNLWFVDLPTGNWAIGSVVTFTYFSKPERWEAVNWQVNVI
jgi:hypothetical protein